MNKGLKEFFLLYKHNNNKNSGLKIRGKTFRLITSGAAVGLVGLALFTIAPISKVSDNTEAATGTATSSETTLSISTGNAIKLSLTPSSVKGTFASASSTITVSTNNYSGYDLKLSTRSNGEDNTSLVNTDDASSKFTSLASTITQADFSAENNTTYNGKWGYNFYNNSGSSNTDYNPSPENTTGVSLDSPTGATTASGNTYTLSIGARAGLDLPAGTYSNTFIISAVAKAITYNISYNTNGGTAVASTTGSTLDTSINLTSTVPTRDSYNFKGWCSTSTSDDTCSGTIYNPDGGGTNLAYGIDQTSDNTTTLYAMWKQSALYMQDVSSWASNYPNAGDTVQAVDNRDGKKYWVTRLADGKLWMTQNLDLDLGGKDQNGNDIVLTSENTNLKTSGSGAYSSGYTNSNGVITWTPARNTIVASSSISGWTDSNTAPYSVNPGDWYWMSDPFYSSTTCNYLTGCTSKFQKTTPYSSNGEHGHVGNYYNWTAAIASNSSSSLSSSTYSNVANNPKNSICPKGWRLPTISSASNSTAGSTNEFSRLNYLYNGGSTSSSQKLEASPLYFVRGGRVYSSSLYTSGYYGYCWSSTVNSSSGAYNLYFGSSYVGPARNSNRYRGFSVRCVAE